MINHKYNNSNSSIKKKKILDILSEIEGIAKKNSLPSIGPIKGEIIIDIIKKYKPKRILEIGTLHGYSAILMANCLLSVNNNAGKDNDNANKETIVTCLEIDQQLANIAKKNIEKAGLSDRIEVITGDALEIIPKLNNHYRFDMIFIDAVKNQYLRYLKLVEESDLMNKEVAVVVVADNVLIYENEMKDYLDYVRNSGKYNSYTTETTLEFTKNVKDALEISLSSGVVVV